MVRAVYFIADQPPNGHRVDGYYSDSAPVEYVNATSHIGRCESSFWHLPNLQKNEPYGGWIGEHYTTPNMWKYVPNAYPRPLHIMINQMVHFGAAKASFSIASAKNLNCDAKNWCWKVIKRWSVGIAVIARKKAVLLCGPWRPCISYPDDLMQYCGVNYDYGGVSARIPTPENLRIIRYLGGGGTRWHGTTYTICSTRYTLPTFTSASYIIMDIMVCTLEAKKGSFAIGSPPGSSYSAWTGRLKDERRKFQIKIYNNNNH